MSKNIIHCDLKPENIKIDSAGKMKILDFGNAVDKSRMTYFQDLHPGTNFFSAPELLQRQRGLVSRATDIFSLGRIFILILRPKEFNKLNPSERQWKRLLKSNDSLMLELFEDISDTELSLDIKGQLEALIEAMIRREPKERLSLDEAIMTMNYIIYSYHLPQKIKKPSPEGESFFNAGGNPRLFFRRENNTDVCIPVELSTCAIS